MRIKVLGCYGSEYPGKLTSCFLVNDFLVIDAGAMTSSITIKQQTKIDYILLSHGHLDHLLDIGFLADNVIGAKKEPVRILGVKSVLDVLMGHIMNNKIWPDFTKIPTLKNPVLSVHPVKPGFPFKINNLYIRAIPVNHTVPSYGFIVHEKDKGAFVYSGDTGPTDLIWETANRLDNLRAVLMEVSFPNKLQKRADQSMHYTPKTMSEDLKKINNWEKLPIYLYHMKPHFYDEIVKDVKALKLPNLKICKQEQIIKI